MRKIFESHNDLPFLPERMITRKWEKPSYSLNDKKEYVVHMRPLIELL